MWLSFLDILLTILHWLIILFNLFGWIFPATRRLHLYVVLLTAGSWLLLGIWYGLGYCFITDWQWQVKAKLGEHNLPNSFIKYQADKLTGADINPALVDNITAVSFGVVFILAIYLNFFRRRR